MGQTEVVQEGLLAVETPKGPVSRLGWPDAEGQEPIAIEVLSEPACKTMAEDMCHEEEAASTSPVMPGVLGGVVAMGLEAHPESEAMGFEVVSPLEAMSYDKELVLIRQELKEYCEKNDITPLSYTIMDPVSIQGPHKNNKHCVSSSIAKAASIIIQKGWLSFVDIPPVVIGTSLNTITAMMNCIMDQSTDDLSWFGFSQWLRTWESFATLGFQIDWIEE
ncbi:PREDICTED: uncharacterized protein LOC104603201 [Nelumbo nucifera]|uniref:Uncharacterized protein LOC104603201 n=1 Tax=Nelumbo nucifera TaxID=4432 RepID=A0A1U8AI17_NELNU|nr:PREDICTED: uncharacterized protein LOC104603201 [Nelumbo nucifera]